MEKGNELTTVTSAQEIIVSRIFDAPREIVFKAWTDPEFLKRWWAPDGCETPRCTVDLRPGGAFLFCMRFADGQEIWGKGIYREIVVPQRIVYTDSFADANGNTVSPAHYGLSEGYPQETLVTVTFSELSGKTKVTLCQSVAPSFAERDGVEQGWNQMVGRLATVLASNS